MIRYLLLLILFLPFFSLSQSVLPLRADTIRMEKIGGSAELHLRNATRDSLGVLTNIGNGRTRFIRARRVGDTLFIGKDTILITNDPTIQEVINNGNTLSEPDSIKISDGNTFTLFAGVGSTLQTKAVSTTSQTEDRFTPDLIVTRMRNLSTGNYKGYSMSSATPGISIFDQQTTSGMGYEADYRANGIANFGNRWIPDWGTVKDTIAAAGGGTDSATVRSLAYNMNFGNTSDSIHIAGDSYSTNPGQGATAGNGWTNKVTSSIGKYQNNVAVGGTGAYQAAKNINVALPGNNNNNGIIASFGLNDIRRGGSGTKTLNKIKNAWYSIIASSFLSDISVPGNSSAITRTGAWGEQDIGSALGGKSTKMGGTAVYSQATGRELTWTFTGNNLVIGTVAYDGTLVTGGTFKVVVDGVSIDTVDVNSQTDGISDGFQNNAQMVYAIVYWDLGYKSHTVTLTTLDANTLYIDYLGVLNGQSNCPPVLASLVPKLKSTSYALGSGDTPPTNAGSVAASNLADSVINLVVNEFNNRKYPVATIPVNDYFNPEDATQLDADLIHPTNAGYAKIAEAVMSRVQPYAYNGVATKNKQAIVYMDPYNKIRLGDNLLADFTTDWFFAGRETNGLPMFGLLNRNAPSNKKLINTYIDNSGVVHNRIEGDGHIGSSDYLTVFGASTGIDSITTTGTIKTTKDVYSNEVWLIEEFNPTDTIAVQVGTLSGLRYPSIILHNMQASANNRKLQWYIDENGNYVERFLNDANTGAGGIRTMNRTGSTTNYQRMDSRVWFTDTLRLDSVATYRSNFGSRFTQHSLIDRNFVDSIKSYLEGLIAGGGDGNGIYSGSGSLAGSHTVTFGSNDLTFAATSAGKFKLNIGSDANGDMFFRNSSGNVARLGIGSAGRILTSDGSTPGWSDPVTVSATPIFLPIGPDPDNFTASINVVYTLPSLAGAGGNKTITLPSASTASNVGKMIIFFNTNTDANVWVFNTAVSYINGTTSTAFANQSAITLLSNGSVWYVLP